MRAPASNVRVRMRDGRTGVDIRVFGSVHVCNSNFRSPSQKVVRYAYNSRVRIKRYFRIPSKTAAIAKTKIQVSNFEKEKDVWTRISAFRRFHENYNFALPRHARFAILI